MPLPDLIDHVLASPVLVFGSPPPTGRDLDLLARAPELGALSEWLRDEGFVERGGEWVRFRDCSVESLDLVPVAAWGLPDEAADELFAEARPIGRFLRLVRPAPRHVLLTLARRLVEGDGVLSGKHRARIEAALAEDGAAWDGARAGASLWRARHALEALERAYGSGGGASRRARAAALSEWPYGPERSAARARARGWIAAGRGRHPRRAHVVSFSGLDGAGKSSQAEALRDALVRLGWDATIQWTRLEWTTLWENRWLGVIGWPARTGLALVARARSRGRRSAEASPDTTALTPAAVRERSNVIANVWVAIVALAHASAQRRETRPHLQRGSVAICDRYTLDSAAHLRFRYGERRAFRPQIRLVERLSPRPLRAYFLDVPPETAFARKAEQYSLEDLTRQARLYREEAEALGVRRLDGESLREELCALIAEDVWRAL